MQHLKMRRISSLLCSNSTVPRAEEIRPPLYVYPVRPGGVRVPAAPAGGPWRDKTMTERATYDGFTAHDLGDSHLFHVGRLPPSLRFDEEAFESLWATHPTEYHRIMIHGREVE